ncbi:SPOR domain-containing protein [Marinomonas sp. CT5]|uniref:SPOR domain-containing protein n=1 Tax=Marinomonas sp. CT5 TaxID=2066133 RepID=UPI0017DC585D|nr:SPOR domain-containing protein [Marinomonas sp. CT5]NVK75659.1 SPOR domain-containing protein [Oceanospirillaceae bacterium]QUX97803.1 SPOR domain-containing protein [Marinomonas sp. CT5]
MKWLFLFIVLLNAAFLSWHSFVQDKPIGEKESVYGPPVSEKIHLLSEAPAVTEQDYNAQISYGEGLEDALSKIIDQNSDDYPSLYCPRLETEREDDKKQIIQTLADFKWPYTVKEVSGKRPKFWLYIAAPDTPAIAERIVKELASKSIDSFVINRAEMKNRISLGLYSSKERAEQAKERIQNVSGYPVDVYEHMRNVPLQQIDIAQPVDENDWEQFMSRFDLTRMMIKVEKNPC